MNYRIVMWVMVAPVQHLKNCIKKQEKSETIPSTSSSTILTNVRKTSRRTTEILKNTMIFAMRQVFPARISDPVFENQQYFVITPLGDRTSRGRPGVYPTHPNGVNLRNPSYFSCNAFHAIWLFCPNGATSTSPGLRPKALPWVDTTRKSRWDCGRSTGG